MPTDSFDEQAQRAEAQVDQMMDTFRELKSIRKAFDGEPVKVIKMSEDFKAHIKKFNLKKESSFLRGDPRVVEEARRLAARRDNTLTIVSTEQGFDLYTMMDQSKIESAGSGLKIFLVMAVVGYLVGGIGGCIVRVGLGHGEDTYNPFAAFSTEGFYIALVIIAIGIIRAIITARR